MGSVDVMNSMSEPERRRQWLEAEMGFVLDTDAAAFVNHDIKRELGRPLILPTDVLHSDKFEEFQRAVHGMVAEARRKHWSSDPPPEPKKPKRKRHQPD